MTEQEALDLVAACKAAHPAFEWRTCEVRASVPRWSNKTSWVVKGEGPGDDLWWVEIESREGVYGAGTARGGALNQVREEHGGCGATGLEALANALAQYEGRWEDDAAWHAWCRAAMAERVEKMREDLRGAERALSSIGGR